MKRRVALLTIIFLLVPVFLSAQVIPTVEREYTWYAEEKLTVSNTVKQLSSEEYGYHYGATRIKVDGYSGTFQKEEVITDGTTGAMGILKNYDSATAPTYLDIQILYNGLDSADIDANDTLTGGTSSAYAKMTGSYTRGAEYAWDTYVVNPQIAEICVLDNSIIWTKNKATPVYSATDASCFGRKQYEGDVFYLFGPQEIVDFKAIRSSGTDAITIIRYGY
jgi:hypothetical protein